MPYSGSFAKKNGLRRHLQGETTNEGQDIDLAFVVKPDTPTVQFSNHFIPDLTRLANLLTA